MNNVTFLGYRSGDPPRIWATETVTGTYGGNPEGLSANLDLQAGAIDVSALDANFNVRIWDTASKNWSATLTDGAGTVGGHSVTFEGGAGGKIDESPRGTTNVGALCGTAAGWAK